MSLKTSKAFRAWRKRMNLTQKAAGDALGLSENAVRNYDLGRRCDWPVDVEVPKHVLLACHAVEKNLPPVS